MTADRALQVSSLYLTENQSFHHLGTPCSESSGFKFCLIPNNWIRSHSSPIVSFHSLPKLPWAHCAGTEERKVFEGAKKKKKKKTA
jgi:hypothetical protein